jgi:chromosome segregation ATPase
MKTACSEQKEELREQQSLVEDLVVEVKKLEERKRKLLRENESLRTHALNFEKERENNEAEYMRAVQERDNALDYKLELQKRIESLKGSQTGLESKQA